MDPLLFLALIGSIYCAGRIAERRGRSFRNWGMIAGNLLGPLAIPLLFLLPNLRGNNGDHTQGPGTPDASGALLDRC